jgi:polyadenylate-binding protein
MAAPNVAAPATGGIPAANQPGRALTGSLYVGDLPTNLENPENVLFELFTKIGMVVSIKVCRDINTQRSLGYAYVNFQNPADAERAMEALNFYTIRPGKQLRIMWCHRDPVLRKSNAGNIFIKNLDESIDNRALLDTFSVFGTILSSKVATDDQGKSRGYGFVHFEAEESAKEAIARVNGMLMNGKPVQVVPFIKKLDRLQEESKTFTNVFIKNLKDTVTKEQVEEVLGKKINSVFVSGHPDHPTKFALLNFEKHDDALAFINEHHEKPFPPLTADDVKMLAFRALKKRDRQAQLKSQASQTQLLQSQGRNLYVKHLDDGITEEELRAMFEPFGEITSAALCKDANGIPRGFGFVCFSTNEAAKNAIREMNGKVISKRPLYVGLAQQKDQRHRMLEEQRKVMQQRMMMQPQNPMYPQYWMGNPGFPNMMNRPGMPGPMPGFGAPFGAMMAGAGMPMGRGFGPQGMRGMGGPAAPMRPPVAARPPTHPAPFPTAPMGKLPQPPAATQRYTQPLPRQPAQTTVSGISSTDLSKMTPEEQKNTLGERLYVKITELRPQQAAKITGMLLEMDTPEILHVLEDNNMLRSKIEEAVAVLRQHSEGSGN